jgi:hypothetical protein
MWSTEYSAETNETPVAVWAALRALHTGNKLSERSDTFEIQGPFDLGTELSVTPHGQGTFRSKIVEFQDGELYADETEVEGLKLLFRHTLNPLPGGGTRIVHTLVIDGEAADEVGPQLGQEISADFPEAMEDLIAAAASYGDTGSR